MKNVLAGPDIYGAGFRANIYFAPFSLHLPGSGFAGGLAIPALISHVRKHGQSKNAILSKAHPDYVVQNKAGEDKDAQLEKAITVLQGRF